MLSVLGFDVKNTKFFFLAVVSFFLFFFSLLPGIALAQSGPSIYISPIPPTVNYGESIWVYMYAETATYCTSSRVSTYGNDWTNVAVSQTYPSLNYNIYSKIYNSSTGFLSPGSATWTFNCRDSAGKTSQASVSFTVATPPAPTVSVSVTPANVSYPSGFSLSMVSQHATSCVWSRSGSYDGNWSNQPLGATFYGSSFNFPPGNATWTFTCRNDFGQTDTASGSVTVTAPPPTVLLNVGVRNTIGFQGVGSNPSYPTNIPVSISIYTLYADSCTASGDWSWTKQTNQNQYGQAEWEEKIGPFQNQGTRTYNLSCTGLGGTFVANPPVSVTATNPPVAPRKMITNWPTAPWRFSFDKNSYAPGETMAITFEKTTSGIDWSNSFVLRVADLATSNDARLHSYAPPFVCHQYVSSMTGCGGGNISSSPTGTGYGGGTYYLKAPSTPGPFTVGVDRVYFDPALGFAWFGNQYLSIPSETYSVSVSGNLPPSAPAISGPTSGSLNTVHSFNFTSTDPDSDQIRYGIDWDNDDTVDNWLPSSGFVDSGVSQSSSRNWASLGAYTLKALAQDVNNLSSSWTSHTIDINVSGTCGNGVCNSDLGETVSNCSQDCPVSTNGQCGSADGGYFSSPPSSNLCSIGSLKNPPGVETNHEAYNWYCLGSGGGTMADCVAGRVVNPPSVSLTSSKSSVSAGEQFDLTWVLGNNPSSCMASALPNNSGWTGNKAPENGSHSQSGLSITADTTFSLTCANLNGSSEASVSVGLGWVKGDGKCDKSKGENFLKSPADCLFSIIEF